MSGVGLMRRNGCMAPDRLGLTFYPDRLKNGLAGFTFCNKVDGWRGSAPSGKGPNMTDLEQWTEAVARAICTEISGRCMCVSHNAFQHAHCDYPKRSAIAAIRASLAAAQQERDEALRDAIEFTQKVDAGLVRDEEYLRLHREKMEQYDRRVAAEARAEKAEAERDASRWQPIETAPKDRPILAWCDHEADPYSVDDKTLTTYAAHAEGLGHAPTGCHIVEWGGGWTESYEDGGGEMSDWWFVAGSEFEVAANPTHWMPLPPAPGSEQPCAPETLSHD